MLDEHITKTAHTILTDERLFAFHSRDIGGLQVYSQNAAKAFKATYNVFHQRS
ncbi:hypothetical protein [Helicobacter mastomyrinus]|uniref:Uncharacterized protein n=1 Tax=Helicobacter mastomyrinus TaxID=287948 RepID=A0ABZ3F527_9HELI|nr:hypothetical protein [uncultured Helicobacter sp.]